MVNVGTYAIHGSYGIDTDIICAIYNDLSRRLVTPKGSEK